MRTATRQFLSGRWLESWPALAAMIVTVAALAIGLQP